MPNYSLYQVYSNQQEFIGKKTVMKNFQESALNLDINPFRYEGKYIYEYTVTYDPRYWSLPQVTSYGVIRCIETIFRKLHRTHIAFEMDYVIEYMKNGYQHIHGQIMAEDPIETDTQKSLHGMLTSKFGRSQWYQTGNDDQYHSEPKMKWSEYIRKDLVKNNENGCIHGYTLKRMF